MSAVSTTEMELKANPNYWGPNKPNLPERGLCAASRPPTQLIEIQKATDEVVLSLSGDQSQSLQGNDKLQVNSFTSPNLTFLYVNVNPDVLSFGANPHFSRRSATASTTTRWSKWLAPAPPRRPASCRPSSWARCRRRRRSIATWPRPRASCRPPGSPTRAVELDYQTRPRASPRRRRPRSRPAWAKSGITITLNGQPSAIATPNYRGGKNPDGPVRLGARLSGSERLPAVPARPAGRQARRLAARGRIRRWSRWRNKAGSTADNASRAKQFQDIQNKLNQESPIYPLLNPGQAVVTTKNLTNVAYSPVWYIDFAAIGSN